MAAPLDGEPPLFGTRGRGLLAFLKLLLQGCEGVDVTEGGGSGLVLDDGFVFADAGGTLSTLCGGSGLLLGTLGCTLGILEDAAVAEDDALGILVKLDNLELELLAQLSLCAVFGVLIRPRRL